MASPATRSSSFATLGACGAALYYGMSALTHAIAAHFPNANAPHVVLAASVGLLFLLLFVWSFRPRPRGAAVVQAAGTVVKGELEVISLGQAGHGEAAAPTDGSMLAAIEVAYSVGGQNYVSRTTVGGGIAARTQAEAQARLAPYPVGTTVIVRYRQGNPGAAALGHRFVCNCR